MRVYIKISYDGSKFCGFQAQTDKNTVASKLKIAFLSLNINSDIIGSGRTDKGVHATNQAICVDLPKYWKDLQKLKSMLNRILNPFIYIKSIQKVKSDFHARFSAIQREYRYIFYHKEFNPFLSSYVHFYPTINIKKINTILNIFKGKHDFTYFKKNGSQTKDFIREIYNIKAIKYKDKTIIVIRANGFLRSQIRMIISASLKAYEEKLSVKELKDQLNKINIYSKSLTKPNALYLHRVYYKKDIYL